jgi:hypothetical protein
LSIAIPPGKRLVFRPYVTIKGKRVYAKAYGKRAFPILIDG